MRVFNCALSVMLGVCAAAGDAAAFCGFYVGGAGARGGLYSDATQVVLMRHGTTTVLSMQNSYRGPPEGFALVVPVPVVVAEDQVKIVPRELFDAVDLLGAPRLVEYWEQDPCWREPEPEPDQPRGEDPVGASSGGGGGGGGWVPPYHVTVEAQFAVGEYDIVVLSATESVGLDRWLRDHGYRIPRKAEPMLRPYVEAGSKFFVARVDPTKVTLEGGAAVLSPLRVHYDSPDFTLPIRLGMANSSGKQDLIINILSPGARYEVANRPNVTIPTNLAVTESTRDQFGAFYAALFDHTVAKVPGAAVTEYAWDASKCDPCPGPTLDGADLATLGYDVVAKDYGYLLGFTLTRLHLRYGTDVADDLVFRAVGPIIGGGGMPDASGAMPTGAQAGYMNAFQGRYAILHRWPGELTCASPQRGRWGGPPTGRAPALLAATDTGLAPRTAVALATMVESALPAVAPMTSEAFALPEAGFVAFPPPPPPCCTDDHWREKIPDPTIGPEPVRRAPHGCGCAGGGGGEALLLAVLFAVAAAHTERKRTRR